MLEMFKSKVLHILTVLFASALPYLNKKLNLEMTPNYMHGVQVLCGTFLGHLWHEAVGAMKLKQLLASAGKAAAALLVALSLVGCGTITPGEIQTGTTIFIGSGLTMASIAEKDPVVKQRIVADCKTIATATNALIPTFFPGATSQQLMNHAVDTSLTILKSKLAASQNGSMIVDLIKAAEVPFTSVLGSSASPTAAMSPTSQADALAFFTGVSSALAMFTGDLTLMPPLPPVPSTTGAPPPPVPAPAPVPPK